MSTPVNKQGFEVPPEVSSYLLNELFKLIMGLFAKKSPTAPTEVTAKPTIPTETIPTKPTETVSTTPKLRKIVGLKINVQWAGKPGQLYSDADRRGLTEDPEHNKIRKGDPFVINCTPKLDDGSNLNPGDPENITYAYLTEVHAQSEGADHFMVGSGGKFFGVNDERNKPNDWMEKSGGFVGFGVSPWIQNAGFMQRMKCYGDGFFEVFFIFNDPESGDAVKSNVLRMQAG